MIAAVMYKSKADSYLKRLSDEKLTVIRKFSILHIYITSAS